MINGALRMALDVLVPLRFVDVIGNRQVRFPRR
jgi:hypothetical protein